MVILTRDHGYRKEPNKLMPIMHLRYPKYKAFLHAMETRHIRYNETLDFLEEQEKEGKEWMESYLPGAFDEAEELIGAARKRKGFQ